MLSKDSIVKTMEKSSKDRARQEIAAEVLELGEMLFDTAIDVAAETSSLITNDFTPLGSPGCSLENQ